jgi:NADPH-dependent 2,4-dienoyl-CoA reductase/sulfur reductase-like enzyme
VPRRIFVVGGGAAGMSAASAARRSDPEAEITVLERGPFPSYGVCGLPYFLGGVIEEGTDLIAYPAAEFRERRRIDLRLDTPVARIDLEERVVRDTRGVDHPYDALVFAGGAAAVVPEVPGVPAVDGADERIVTIRRLEDAIALASRLPEVRRAVVVGAGYVGLEMAEALHARGIQVTIVDRLPRIMTTVDAVVAEQVAAEVHKHAALLLDTPLREVRSAGAGLEVVAGDAVLETDLVVLALGVRPVTDLVASLDRLPNGAILVDEQMRTSDPHVFAAGDCVAVHHRVIDGPAYVPLGPTANKAGRVAGTVAAGGDARFDGIVGTAVVKVFDLTVAHTGLTLEDAQARGLDARATDVTAKSRAKYYPGAAPLFVRLVHEANGRLLGAQLLGRDGVAQRVNVVAAALHMGMGVDDLAALDLAYAPPFSPVYDPVTQAAQKVAFTRGRGA